MNADGVPQNGPMTLESLENLSWALLNEGWQRIHEPFYLGTLSSISKEGRPTSRLMVVREVDVGQRRLFTHTDLRAAKVEGIKADAQTSWVFYDTRRFIQVLLNGATSVHAGDDPLVRPQWDALPPGDRVCYCERQPSTTMAQDRLVGRPSVSMFGATETASTTAAEAEPGYVHFGVLMTRVESLEIQYLGPGYQYRAHVMYSADAAAPVKREWLTV